jgi:hypothetical protein
VIDLIIILVAPLLVVAGLNLIFTLLSGRNI